MSIITSPSPPSTDDLSARHNRVRLDVKQAESAIARTRHSLRGAMLRGDVAGRVQCERVYRAACRQHTAAVQALAAVLVEVDALIAEEVQVEEGQAA